MFLATSILVLAPGGSVAFATTYEQARWDPIHFKPAIDTASDAQCLACHREVLERRPLPRSPSGIETTGLRTWYQHLDTYQGPQETMHRRHLVTALAKRLMAFKCNTCHQGHDPREEAATALATSGAVSTLRKSVHPENCLMCHGRFDYRIMELPGSWHEVRDAFPDGCLSCHGTVRARRHQVNFLRPDAIEEAGRESADSCYGCHGGRAWYRIAYPYPRHAWPGMPAQTPAWAVDRATESDARFLPESP
jgi:hypothetical protein